MPLGATASARDRRIAFERSEESRDAFNAVVRSWQEIGKAWASVSFGTGQERRDAGQEGASVTATFRVLRTPVSASLTVEDRITFMGATWDISSTVPAEGRAAIDITATRAA